MSISRLSRIWLALFKSSLQSGFNPISSYIVYAQLFKTMCIIIIQNGLRERHDKPQLQGVGPSIC